MSGRGKREKIKRKSKTRSNRAGLDYIVDRIRRWIRNGNYAKKVGVEERVYLAAAIRYLTIEVLELVGHTAIFNEGSSIIPNVLQYTIRKELYKLMSEVEIEQGDVLSNIKAILLPS